MPIPESQLDTWSAQGAGVGSRDTYDVVRRALEAGSYNNSTPTIFLQGSYGNDTNVWSESDVDVVIRTDEVFFHNIAELTTAEQTTFHSVYGSPSYAYSTFKNDVTKALTDRFGGAVSPAREQLPLRPKGNAEAPTSSLLRCTATTSRSRPSSAR